MKKTKKWFFFTLCEFLFVAIVPLVIVFLGYDGWGQQANRFKIYFGVLLILLIVFWLIKKVFISPWLDKQKIKAGALEAQLEAETDKDKISNIVYALRRVRVLETVLTWILPLVFLLLAFLASRALEQSIVKFSGILGFVGLSEMVGFFFGVLSALCVNSKNE